MHRNPRDVGKKIKVGCHLPTQMIRLGLGITVSGTFKETGPTNHEERKTANRWCLPRYQWWSGVTTSYIIHYFFSFQFIYGNSRILNWMYVSTIFLAIFCRDIQFRILKFPLSSFHTTWWAFHRQKAPERRWPTLVGLKELRKNSLSQ